MSLLVACYSLLQPVKVCYGPFGPPKDSAFVAPKVRTLRMLSYSHFVLPKVSSGYQGPRSLCNYAPLANRTKAKFIGEDGKLGVGL